MRREGIPVFPVLIVLLGFLSNQVGGKVDNHFRFERMDNGMFSIVEQRRDTALVHIVLAVRAGSKYEPGGLRGVSHLIEHLVLFGNIPSADLAFFSDLRSRGIFWNGHTDRDLVTIEWTCPREEMESALKRLGKMVFQRRFQQSILHRERAVVKNEKSEAVDHPQRRGLVLMFNHLFAGHAYSRSNLGTSHSLDGITLEDVQRHYNALFVPRRCAVALVGDLDLDKAMQSIRMHLGIISDSPDSSELYNTITKLSPLEKSIEITKRTDLKKAHIWIGYRAPAYNHHQRMAMRVLCQMLGRGGFPLLGTRLSGRFRLADSMSMNYLALEEAGCAWIHLVLDPANTRRAMHEVDQFFKNFSHMNFSIKDLPPSRRHGVFDFMETALNQLRVRSESGNEAGLRRALTLARFTLLNKRRHPASATSLMEALTPSRLRRTVAKYILKPHRVVITLLPEAAP